MFDRRKALVEIWVILEEWQKATEGQEVVITMKALDALGEILEKHFQEVYRRGYLSAVNPDSPDNQPSE